MTRATSRAVADALMAVLLAPLCVACRRPLDHPTRSAVCPTCWSSIVPMREPLCEACGDSLSSWRAGDGATCARCRRRPRVITRGRAIAAYEGVLREALLALKYSGRRSLARPLGELMAVSGALVLQGAGVAVPVPLHLWRKYRRGFNQAAELARHLPIASVDALRRVKRTATQTDLPEAERHANVQDAFALRPQARRRITGAVVVLVDDVSTTGATLDACARVLLDGGAREVRALTAARAASRLL